MSVPSSTVALIRTAYAAFNERDIDATLATMKPDVEWPNGMEGGWVHGHEEVRAYWTRQWSLVDPHVEPVGFESDESGRVVVTVHQVVRDLSGKILLERSVQHIYSFKDGLICQMEIRE
jgi:ketosteroid isomerase-like protein